MPWRLWTETTLRDSRRNSLRLSITAGFITIIVTGSSYGNDNRWFGGIGTWETVANWSLLRPPTESDRAVVNIGTSQFSTPITVGGFRLGSASLSGTEDFVVAGDATWAGGTMGGTAHYTFRGNTTISTNVSKWLGDQAVLSLAGNTTWARNTIVDGNTINLVGTVLNNNAVFSDQNTFDTSISGALFSNAFNNNGTYRKSGGSTTWISAAFNNTGSVLIERGILRLSDGTSSGGRFSVANGAVLRLTGPYSLNGAGIEGPGLVEIAGILVRMSDSTISAPVQMTPGSVLTGSGATFSHSLTWSGGLISGFGTFRSEGGTRITGDEAKYLDGRVTVFLAGDTTWDGNTGDTGNEIVFNGGTFKNQATFTDSNSFSSSIRGTAGDSTFENSGTYRKTGPRTTAIQIGFENSGVVDIVAGSLSLRNARGSGTFNVNADAQLLLGSSRLGNAAFRGDGIVELSGSQLLNGTSFFTPVTVSGSTTILGTGATFQGPVNWTGGSFADAGTYRWQGTNRLSAFMFLSGGATLILDGNTAWTTDPVTSSRNIVFVDGTLINRATLTDDEASDTSMLDRGGSNVFNNRGLYRKAGTGTTTIQVNLVNSGQMDLSAGTLSLSSAFDNAGLISIGEGAVLASTRGGVSNATTGVVSGAGTIVLSGGSFRNDGRLAPGGVMTAGQLAIDGNLVMGAESVLEIGVTDVLYFDTLAVSGSVLLNGRLVLRGLTDFIPGLGDSFRVLTSNGGQIEGGAFSAISWEGLQGIRFDATYNAHDVTLNVVAIPEPSTQFLMLAGTFMVGGLALRRKRRLDAR